MSWLDAFLSAISNQIVAIWGSPEATVILLGVIGALLGVLMANRTIRRRTTIDRLIDTNWDKDFIEAKNRFNILAKEPEKMVQTYLLTKLGATGRRANIVRAQKDIEHIRLLLNHYELIAIGIREGILDEVIYRRWFQIGFIRDWEVVSDLVSRLRRDYRPTLFAEFEELTGRWRSEGPLKRSVKHYRFWGRHITISRSH